MGTYSFRITTNGVLRNYRANLMKSRARLETSSERVMTHRNYNSYAEDPTSASRAFQLRRSIWRTNDALDNTNHAIGIYQTAWSNLDAICDGNLDHPGFDGIKESLYVLNGPTGSGRAPLGQSLRAEATSIVQVMNGQYAGNFVFAGADGHNVPFSWDTNEKGEKILLYRGVNVSTPDPGDPTKNPPGGFLGDCLNDHNAQVDELMKLETLPEEVEARTEWETQIGTDKDGNPLYNKTVIERELNGATMTERRTVTDPDGTLLSDVTTTTTIATDAANTTSTKIINTYDNRVDPDTPVSTQTTVTTVTKTPANPTIDDITTVTRTTSVNGGAGTSVQTEVPSAKTIFEEKSGISYDKAVEDYAKLKKMNEETTYVDIGIGMEEDADGTIPTSAFNTALSGIDFLGFGVDEDGYSLNMAVLMQQLGELAGRCDPRTGAYAEGDQEKADTLTIKLRAALDRVQEKHVELDARTKYLNSNAELLTTTRDQLDEQRANIEQINPALAIEEMSWANYCYQAALKIGSDILSQSLLDYMR